MLKSKKRERFLRTATRRVNYILRGLRLLRNCSNRYIYDYTEEDVKKIFEVIRDKVDEVEASFRVEIDTRKKFELE
ncbi:MAG: hypothetical protein QXO40_00170 [Candidatus Aenigmatarchaeota archaeon]